LIKALKNGRMSQPVPALNQSQSPLRSTQVVIASKDQIRYASRKGMAQSRLRNKIKHLTQQNSPATKLVREYDFSNKRILA
jgi:hypothetical protein